MNRASRSGFTLTELLIAGSILLVVLSVLFGFVNTQGRANQLVQARNEVQDSVRAVTQLLLQDLQLSGASRHVSGNTVGSVSFSGCSTSNPCVSATDGGARDAVRTRYLTSLRDAAGACRTVDYTFSGTTLQRSDVSCGVASAPVTFATDVQVLNLVFVCSDGRTVNTPSCPTPTATAANPNPLPAYPRSVRVSLYTASAATVPNAAAASFQYTDAAGASQTVSCPTSRVCFGGTQEITLANLKDQ